MKRPYKTHYYSSVRAKVQAWSSHGHAASDVGAVRAAVVRIFVDQYAVARIYDQDGALAYTLYRGRDGLHISYGEPKVLPTDDFHMRRFPRI